MKNLNCDINRRQRQLCPFIRIGYCIFLIILLNQTGATSDLMAQTVPMRFFSADDGLVFNEVVTGYQDKANGYLWFCTFGGVSRFDGKHFVNYTEQNSGIGGPTTRDIIEDEQNIIWVAYIGGIAKLVDERFTNYTASQGLPGNDVVNLWPDPIKGVWGLTEKGVFHLVGDVFVNYAINAIESGFFNKLTGSPTGDIYVATKTGVVWKKSDQQEFEPLINADFHIRSINYHARESALYIVSGAKLYRYQKQRLTLVAEAPQPIDFSNIAFGTDGDIWLQAENALWHRQAGANQLYTADMLNNYALSDIFLDREGNIWLTSWSGTARIIHPKIAHYPNLTHTVVTRILKDADHNFWVGGSKGVTKMAPHGKILTHIDTKFVEYLYLADEQLYACLADQVAVYDLNGNQVQTFTTTESTDTYYSCIMRDSHGKFWIGSYNGLFSLNESGELTLELDTSNGLGSNSVTCFMEDPLGRIWVGTEKGLSCLENGAWNRYDVKDGLSHAAIWDLSLYENNGLLIATGMGINVFHDGAFSRLAGLSDAPVGSVALTGNGAIWAGNRNGLYKLDQKGNILLHLNKNAGLPTDSMYYRTILLDQDYLYMGSHKGAFRVALDLEKPQPVGPLVYLAQMEINNQAVDLATLSTPLHHLQNNISFNLNAIYAFLPDQVKYAYYLKGNDEQWSAGSPINRAVYTNLKPGNYTFYFKALAEAGKTSAIQSVTFVITPAYWQTWQFYSLISLAGLLLIVGAIFLISRIYIRRSEEYARVLEERVKTRTMELSEVNQSLNEEITQRKKFEIELRKAKEAADRANLEKTEFITSMSHEIRTPMNVILGVTDMLKETLVDGAQQKHLQILRNSGKNMLALINDILDLSKIEAGLLEVEAVGFDIRSLIDGIAELMMVRAREKRLDFFCQIADDIPKHLVGDPLRIKQILINLINNAIKFTAAGEVKVELICLETNKKADGVVVVELLFSVTDTGIGIPVEKQSSVFDKFTQAKSSTAREYGGSGLGLTICKRLVELMKGSIWVESEPQKGSRFMFTAEFEVGSATDHEENASVPFNIGMKMKPPKILLVEDHEENQMVFTFYINKIPNQLICAGNGQEALEKVASERPEIVFMDLEMPVMDGLTAARRIREWEKETHSNPIVIIALSAKAMKEDREKCYQAGMNDYLSKPFDFEELFTVLMRWIKPHDKEITTIRPQDYAHTLKLKGLPESLPGIDVAEGCKRFLGNIQTYQRILEKFFAGYENFDSMLEKIRQDKDTVALQQFSHTVKGISGNISAQELFLLSGAIEADLRSGKPMDWEAQIEHYKQVFKQAINSINKLIQLMKEAVLKNEERTDC